MMQFQDILPTSTVPDITELSEASVGELTMQTSSLAREATASFKSKPVRTSTPSGT